MSNNPYIDQVCAQTGMTEREVRKSSRPCVISDEQAQARGYANAQEYEQAIHEFLNEQ